MSGPLIELATASLPTEAGWLAIGLSYLLGAVPFGLVLVWITTRQDLREVGSGNIGATNAMRAAGKPIGLVSFLCDWAKGWVPVVVIAPSGRRLRGARSSSPCRSSAAPRRCSGTAFRST